MPDEMFICSADFSKWIHFHRTSIVMGPTPGDISQARNMFASDLNSSPHTMHFWSRTVNAFDPIIANKIFVWDDAVAHASILYMENADVNFNPGKGSLVFVRKAPLPQAGGGAPSGYKVRINDFMRTYQGAHTLARHAPPCQARTALVACYCVYKPILAGPSAMTSVYCSVCVYALHILFLLVIGATSTPNLTVFPIACKRRPPRRRQGRA